MNEEHRHTGALYCKPMAHSVEMVLDPRSTPGERFLNRTFTEAELIKEKQRLWNRLDVPITKSVTKQDQLLTLSVLGPTSVKYTPGATQLCCEIRVPETLQEVCKW